MGILDLIREYDKKKERQRWNNVIYRREKFEEYAYEIKTSYECKLLDHIGVYISCIPNEYLHDFFDYVATNHPEIETIFKEYVQNK